MTQQPPAPIEDPQYCPRCAAPLVPRSLPSEDRPRLVCDRGHILYVNPKVIVGVIPERRGRILLMRRAIEPRYGAWTFPGGFMEIDETAAECAAREALEARWFRPEDIPWDELAYETTNWALRDWLKARRDTSRKRS